MNTKQKLREMIELKQRFEALRRDLLDVGPREGEIHVTENFFYEIPGDIQVELTSGKILPYKLTKKFLGETFFCLVGKEDLEKLDNTQTEKTLQG